VLELEEAGGEVADAANPDLMSPLGYSPEVSYLSLIADRLIAVRDAVIGSNGSDPPPFTPLPRPTTALDRLREDTLRSGLLELDRVIRG
jgi:hypothetical protein